MTAHWIYGLDFGASNSAISLVRDGQTITLAVDKIRPDENIIPTLLYYTKTNCYIGHEAQKIMRKNSNTRGRFIRNIKSALSLSGIDGTYIWKEYKTFSDIVGDYIYFVRKTANDFLQHNVKEVVIGRPVRFSRDKDEDQQAQEYIRKAAIAAGFQKVYFTYEPVAATVGTLAKVKDTIILTFDFGGSTLDFHLLSVKNANNRRHIETLSTHGMVLGGNNLTKQIVKNKLLKYFGHNIAYKSKFQDRKLNPKGAMLVPNSLPFSLLDEDINRSSDQSIYEQIRKIQWDASSEIKELNQLETCLRNKLYYKLFDVVEKAKVELSSEKQTNIKFCYSDIEIDEQISRHEFEEILAPYGQEVISELNVLLDKAKITPEDVKGIIRVGGSSEIPYFIKLLKQQFPCAEIITSDIFTGVSKGLAELGQKSDLHHLLL